MKEAKKGSGRNMAVRLKRASKLSHSSQQWLTRQLNDPFVARARAEGYRSRAAFKFLEIDDRYRLLKPGQRIADLGAAPGGWCQIAARRVKSLEGKGRVVGIDILPVEAIPGVVFEQLDFNDAAVPDRLKLLLEGPADGVLSDMAANTTGHRKTDHLRIIALAELAVEFACDVLAPGGFFLIKLFQGGETAEIVARLKREFSTVRHIKPDASRQDSSELYVLASGFRAKR